MSRPFDRHRAEVDREHVERRLRAALKGADQVTDKRVGAVLLHDRRHHPVGARAREGSQRRHRQGFCPHADAGGDRPDVTHQQVDPTGGGTLRCGIYHIPWFTTEDGEMPILYTAMPRVDIVEHGGRYLCWQCHYPHDPEGR